MQSLEEIRTPVERIVNAIAHSLKLEVAIFDISSNLFFCTPTYLKKKGRTVHAPFIQEVMNNGSVLVNTPGQMQSCIGCRFKNHCPSTIEVLCCIRSGAEVLGVVDFTSFTKEGQRRITENTPTYLNAIAELSTLIGDFLLNKSDTLSFAGIEHLVAGAMEFCSQPLLLADPYGVILKYNRMASSVFKFCNSASSSLWQLFPREAVNKITSGNDLFEKPVSLGNLETRVSTKTITIDQKPSAIFVRFSDELFDPPKDESCWAGIIGESPGIVSLRRMIKKVADSPTSILITGETGTGKELIARAIHEQSARNKYPFVAINCSSIPESLFESELFGYEEGSFTGAKRGGKIGRIEMAQGGTLFLDELGEMPLAAQPKLLRVLQEYELERVGSTKKIQLDIRVIAATNKTLPKMLADGRFREDLFYRISVINLTLPALRERKEDILPIAYHYLDKLKGRLESPLTTLSPEVEEVLSSYPWPGNIRELQNVIEYAANLCESSVLTLADLPDSMKKKALIASGTVLKQDRGVTDKTIEELLERYGYTLQGKKRIADELGVSLRTLYRRINKLSN